MVVNTTKSKCKKKLSIKNKILFSLFIITLITSIIGIYYVYVLPFADAKLGTSDNQTDEQIKARMKEKVDESILAVDMNQQIVLKKWNSQAMVNIENLPENNYDISVEIYTRDKNPKLIYNSTRIKPGYIIRKDTLDARLEKGVHGCIVTFIAVDKWGKEIKRVNAQIDIIIQE